MGLHDVGKLDAAVVQAARGRDALSVLQQVALHAAYLGDAHQHAGAVAVAQTLFDLTLIELGADGILLLNAAAQRFCVALQNTGILLDVYKRQGLTLVRAAKLLIAALHALISTQYDNAHTRRLLQFEIQLDYSNLTHHTRLSRRMQDIFLLS